jgi:gamma-glutamyl hercynylcysteine S-oxide synthase
MRELYEPSALEAALRDSRRRTLDLYAHLAPRWEVPYLEMVNPPLWELSHIAWFQEYWCLRLPPGVREGNRSASCIPEADPRFNSAVIAHKDRWAVARMDPAFVFGYLEATLEATAARVAAGCDGDFYFPLLSLYHEDMHGEALLMTLQTLALPAPELGSARPPRGVAGPARDVPFEGGMLHPGTRDDSPDFAFDNERLAHPQRVEPFAIAERPVTAGEFAAFVEDGGYGNEAFWPGEAGAWKAARKAEAPRDWRRESGGWSVRRFDRWEALDAEAPVQGVCLHEAEAWCRWAGRRLPTETEWEFAARGGDDRRYPWGDAPGGAAASLDHAHAGPSLANAGAPGAGGLRLMLGGVWEWTATPFAPYPGFVPGPYKEYSEPWFHDHFVLRGGSFATRSRLANNRYRNFYRPGRNDVFAGFRTCAVRVR